MGTFVPAHASAEVTAGLVSPPATECDVRTIYNAARLRYKLYLPVTPLVRRLTGPSTLPGRVLS